MSHESRTNRRYVLVLVLVIVLTFGVLALTRVPWFAPEARAQGHSAPFRGSVRVADVTDTGVLVLVNAEHPVPGNAKNGLAKAWPTIAVRENEIELNSSALRAAKEMFGAADKAGFGSLYLTSGYRDAAAQKKIYNEAADKSYVQRPGFSEHETGLAADILASKVNQNAFAGSPQGRWLAEHSWEYGFVLRYPSDKTEVTGIAYESWHFRYVGKPHAWYCARHGLALEEYLTALKSGLDYSVELDGVEYSVAYQMANGGKIAVPDDREYGVSSDNTGGYVVTAWR